MEAIAKDHDEQQVVLTTIEALMRDGHYMAGLAARFLDGWFKSLGCRKKPPALPAEFLLELAAVIRIALWQRAGLTTEMDADFSPAAELLQKLLDRLLNDPASFCLDPGDCPAPLYKKVGQLWFRYCSWTATSDLGVDMVMHPVDPELLLDELAKLLFAHRHLARKGFSDGSAKEE